MKKFQFGVLRSFSLLEENDPEFGKIIGGEKLIGTVNDLYDLMVDKNQNIVIRDMPGNARQVIASSEKSLIKMLKEITIPWKLYPDALVLPPTDENKNWLKKFINKQKKLNNNALPFWVEYAFRELDIRWEI